MERFENLLDFINELNENGRIPYDDYSRLFDLVQEFAGAEEAINAAATDIAALLWLNGNCEYRCATCNGETPLHDLTSAHIRCKCGKHFKYRTNFEEDFFTYSCLSCGAPVDLAYNKKARTYQTVR